MYPGALRNVVARGVERWTDIDEARRLPTGATLGIRSRIPKSKKITFLAAPFLGEEERRKCSTRWKLESASGVGELMALVKVPA